MNGQTTLMQAVEQTPAKNNQTIGQVKAQSREAEELKMQVFMAKTYPRNEQDALKKIESSCSRISLASKSIYTFARGGSNITGPSIRLAEEIKRCWGNVRSGWEALEETEDYILVKAYATDIETNTTVERTFNVPMQRDTKKGTVHLSDSRDRYEMCANQASRRLRACILELIPADIKDFAVEKCQETVKRNTKFDAETISKLVDAFSRFGVTPKMIEARVQRKVSSITPDQVVNLRGVYQSLADGVGKVEDFFDTSIKETLAEQTGEAQAIPAPAEQPAPKPRKSKAKAAPVQSETASTAPSTAPSPLEAPSKTPSSQPKTPVQMNEEGEIEDIPLDEPDDADPFGDFGF